MLSACCLAGIPVSELLADACPYLSMQTKYGVLSVECSVSGVFFKDYPRTKLLDGPHVWERSCPFPERFNSFRDTVEFARQHPSETDNHSKA